MKKMVSEDIHDFIDPEDEVTPEELEGFPDEEFQEDENGEEYIEVENSMDQMKKAFEAEIAIPEYSRISYLLKLKDGRQIEGTPMAELSSGDAFLFKVEGQLKKIKLADIQNAEEVFQEEESEEVSENFSRGKFVLESNEDEEDEYYLDDEDFEDSRDVDPFDDESEEIYYEEEDEE